MPTHRGIKISVVSQIELKVHPEFPHPESSQFTYRSPDLRKGATNFTDWTPPSASSDSKADRLLGRQSIVSVYIPSMPATRFWIRYNIVEAAVTHSQWFYFKLFMNGRHITSWGTNVENKPSGQIMRGLFEPSDRWNYKHEGTVFKNMGTEARPFIFGREETERSAANDGGLIEVMVFRARGRKRRLPKPTDFKNQEGYGIVMPSGGLLEKPQDAKFYDWHLKDPKDSPFATFKFHYRSWDSLINLQLIPDNHPRTLLAPSPSILSLNGVSRDLQRKLDEDSDDKEDKSPSLKHSMSSNINISDPWLTSVFDDSPQHLSQTPDKRSTFTVPPENSPFRPSGHKSPQIPASRFSAAVIDKPTSPNSSPWKNYLDRPLPEVPTRESSLKHQHREDHISHSRSSSGISHTPSIAPSLLQYLDRDTLSPEPILGVAQIVDVTQSPNIPFPSPTLSLSDFPSAPRPNVCDLSEPTSPRPATSSTSKSKREVIASSPLNTLVSMTNITIRKTRRSPTKRHSKSQPQPFTNSPSNSPCPAPSRAFHNLDDNTDEPLLEENTPALSLSESEWMCRTPSPPRMPRFGSLQRLWSPGLGSDRRTSRDAGKEMGTGMPNEKYIEKGNSQVGSIRAGGDRVPKMGAPDWYQKVEVSDENLPGEAFDNSENRGRMSGNWI